MGLYDHWPYTNFHELNLSWLLRRMEELSNVVENFVALNTIKYADPIQWNITTQYEANTVVVDPQNGTAYISSRPVPAGVAITNTDYWSVIFTLDMLSANDNITFRDDGSNVISTFTSAAGDWLLWNGDLYKVSQNINLNEAYVVGYNLTRYTVELFIKDYVNEIITIIGDLNDLNTTDKDSIVDAINEIVGSIGDLTTLTTTDKNSLVNAINELNSVITALKANIDTIIINVKDYGATGDGITDDSQAIQDAYDAGESQKSIVYFPEGTYYITKGIRVCCDTLSKGTLKVASPVTALITGYDYFYGGALIYGEGLTIDGLNVVSETTGTYYPLSDTTSSTKFDGIQLAATSKNITLKNCNIDVPFRGLGVWCCNGEYIKIENCHVVGGGGIFTEVRNEPLLTKDIYKGIYVENSSFKGTNSAYLGDSLGSTFVNCYFESFTDTYDSNIRIIINDAIITQLINNVEFIGCTFDHKSVMATSVGNVHVTSYNTTSNIYGTMNAKFDHCIFINIPDTSKPGGSSVVSIDNQGGLVVVDNSIFYNGNLSSRDINNTGAQSKIVVNNSTFNNEHILRAIIRHFDASTEYTLSDCVFNISDTSGYNAPIIAGKGAFTNCKFFGMSAPVFYPLNDQYVTRCTTNYTSMVDFANNRFKYHGRDNLNNGVAVAQDGLQTLCPSPTLYLTAYHPSVKDGDVVWDTDTHTLKFYYNGNWANI